MSFKKCAVPLDNKSLFVMYVSTKMSLGQMVFRWKVMGATTLRTMTHSILTLSIMTLFATLTINDSQPKRPSA